MQRFLTYPWPGNVRELKSAIEHAVIHGHGAVIVPADLPLELTSCPTVVSDLPAATPPEERHAILEALQRSRGNRTKAAGLLGMSRATLYRRLHELAIPLKTRGR